MSFDERRLRYRQLIAQKISPSWKIKTSQHVYQYPDLTHMEHPISMRGRTYVNRQCGLQFPLGVRVAASRHLQTWSVALPLTQQACLSCQACQQRNGWREEAAPRTRILYEILRGKKLRRERCRVVLLRGEIGSFKRVHARPPTSRVGTLYRYFFNNLGTLNEGTDVTRLILIPWNLWKRVWVLYRFILQDVLQYSTMN